MNEILTFVFSTKFLIYLIISLIPILGWIYFFQKINREKKSYVALTFTAGMLAVVPIKIYEKYWNQAVFYFEHINLFTYLSDLLKLPGLSKFLSYIIVNGLVAMMLFLFTALMMFVLEILTQDNTLKVFKNKLRHVVETPLFFMSIGILLGIIAYIFSYFSVEKEWFSTPLNSKISFFIIVGMLEEFIKHLVLRFSDEEKIQSVSDAISFSIIVALGFAFIENIMYFHNFINREGGTLISISIFFFLRSTISVIAHVSFSAILGYFYGIARFSEQICQREIFRTNHPIFIKIQQFLHMKCRTLFHEEKMMEGMILAMLAHAIFNGLLHYNKIMLVIPFLFAMFFWTLNLFHRRESYQQSKSLVEPN